MARVYVWAVLLHSSFKGNSHDLHLEKWYISATLLFVKMPMWYWWAEKIITMKRNLFLLVAIVIVVSGISNKAFGQSSNEYVDLGLPSGTLWKISNEKGYYTAFDAVKKYGNSLPDSDQFEELKVMCIWEWFGNGYRVTGPNGNHIMLHAMGIKVQGDDDHPTAVAMGEMGYYWSRTHIESTYFYLAFRNPDIVVDEMSGGNKISVRLVK